MFYSIDYIAGLLQKTAISGCSESFGVMGEHYTQVYFMNLLLPQAINLAMNYYSCVCNMRIA